MAHRNQSRVRRDFERLLKLFLEWSSKRRSMGHLAPEYQVMNNRIVTHWQGWGQASRNGDLQRSERAEAQGSLTTWVQEWRPIILLQDAAAEQNLQQMPSGAPTHDDFVRMATDMKSYLQNECKLEGLRAAALEDLGDRIETAEKETDEAAQARRDEIVARAQLTETMIEANTMLVRGLEVVRAAFGSNSPEYRQFMVRSTTEEEKEDDDNIFFDDDKDKEDGK